MRSFLQSIASLETGAKKNLFSLRQRAVETLLRQDADEALPGRAEDGERNGSRLHGAVAGDIRVRQPASRKQVRPALDGMGVTGLREKLKLKIRPDGARD